MTTIRESKVAAQKNVKRLIKIHSRYWDRFLAEQRQLGPNNAPPELKTRIEDTETAIYELKQEDKKLQRQIDGPKDEPDNASSQEVESSVDQIEPTEPVKFVLTGDFSRRPQIDATKMGPAGATSISPNNIEVKNIATTQDSVILKLLMPVVATKRLRSEITSNSVLLRSFPINEQETLPPTEIEFENNKDDVWLWNPERGNWEKPPKIDWIPLIIILVFILLGVLTILFLKDSLPSSDSDSKQSGLYTWLVTHQKPYSTFVPSRNIVQVEKGEEFTLKTRHVSLEDLDSLEITVDETTFNYLFSTTKKISLFVNNKIKIYVSVDAPHHGTSTVKPKYPTNDEWIVTLGWISEVPGTYDLRITTTDGLGRQGDPITQRIEVKEATP